MGRSQETFNKKEVKKKNEKKRKDKEQKRARKKSEGKSSFDDMMLMWMSMVKYLPLLLILIRK